jgi:hypothetical protein
MVVKNKQGQCFGHMPNSTFNIPHICHFHVFSMLFVYLWSSDN